MFSFSESEVLSHSSVKYLRVGDLGKDRVALAWTILCRSRVGQWVGDSIDFAHVKRVKKGTDMVGWAGSVKATTAGWYPRGPSRRAL